MTHRDRVIQAIKELNFSMLDVLLDDDRPYFEVSKDVFLDSLKEITEDIESFESVVVRPCTNEGQKGCVGCRFYRPLYGPFLQTHKYVETAEIFNLCIKEEDGRVIDFCCNDCIAKAHENELICTRYLYFYDDQKVSFQSPSEYLRLKDDAAAILKDYKALASKGVISLEEFVDWYRSNLVVYLRIMAIQGGTKYNSYLKHVHYIAFKEFENLMRKIEQFVEIYDTASQAKAALREYITNFGNADWKVEEWVKNKESLQCLILPKNRSWLETGLINPDFMETDLYIDCRSHIESFLFQDIHWTWYLYLDLHLEDQVNPERS